MTTYEVTQLFISLAVLLGVARKLGQWARHFGLPVVLGELCAGLILGPTVLQRIAPSLEGFLFPRFGAVSTFFAGFNQLGTALLLVVAGLEINVAVLKQNRRVASMVSVSGILFPFALGLFASWFWGEHWGMGPGQSRVVFSLFFATAMAISALPVIAKTLMDLGIYKSDVGTITITAAVIDDLIGWMVFAIVLSMANLGQLDGFSFPRLVFFTLVFTAAMMTVVRPLMVPVLKRLKGQTERTLSFCLMFALFSAAVTEWIGIHALFGAFMAGAALGETEEMDAKMRDSMKSFVSSFFTPIVFAGVGLKADFIANFDVTLVLSVIAIASIGKVIGCGLAAKATGLDSPRAWAVGVCMNARGAMEIILGLLALEHGLIGNRLFVALVVMALVTSAAVGPILKRLKVA